MEHLRYQQPLVRTLLLGIESQVVNCPKCQHKPRLYGHELVNCEIAETMNKGSPIIDRLTEINTFLAIIMNITTIN